MPSPTRGVSAIALQLGREVLLFDCGEGTQRQFMLSTVSFMKVTAIFISHFHGDHFLGLPGLIQSMSFSGRREPLAIYGPPGMVELTRQLVSLGYFQLGFEVVAGELVSGDAIDLGALTVTALAGDHTVPSLSFIVQEKDRPGRFQPDKAMELGVVPGPQFSLLQSGREVVVGDRVVRPGEVMGPPRRGRKVVISGDTRPTARLAEAAKEADVLIHEATMDSSLQEGASIHGHSTAREAGEVAREANVRLLVLTHISSRYEDPSGLEAEAREVFPSTIAAHDLMTLTVSHFKGGDDDRNGARP
jgi:ribonuclease Z